MGGEEDLAASLFRGAVEWLWLALLGVVGYVVKTHKARTDKLEREMSGKADHASVKELSGLIKESISKGEERAVTMHEKIERSNSELSTKLDQRYADLRGSIDDTNKTVLGLAISASSDFNYTGRDRRKKNVP